MPVQKNSLLESQNTLQNLCLDVVGANFRVVADSWLLNCYKVDQFDPENRLFLTAFDMMRNYYHYIYLFIHILNF